MSWIKEYAKGSFRLYSGNPVDAFQPLDFFHFYGLWYDLWLDRIIKTMEKLGVEQKSYRELREILPTPSNLRALIQKAIPAYAGSQQPNKDVYRRYVNFVSRMLEEACPADPFGKKSTPLHSSDELNKIVADTKWIHGDLEKAKMLGRLITAAGSLVHGLYNDVVTDFGWDTYGPYVKQLKDGEVYTFLIRNFPDLSPEIWPKELLPQISELKILQLYQDVEWEIGFIGCHTIVKSGDPIAGLKYFSVIADGKVLSEQEIRALIQNLAAKAEKIYSAIRKKDFEELKILVMLQECYQLKKLLDKAEMDWKPTPEMLEAIKDKELLKGILPHGIMMSSLEQYEHVFHLDDFDKEVLSV